MSFNALTHPYTLGLCKIAETVGFFLAMHFKARFNRPRPSRISHELLPPVEGPGHASYPSGHATQSYLIAEALKAARP